MGRFVLSILLLQAIAFSPQETKDVSELQLQPISRKEIMATAQRLAQHTWVCRKKNLHAPCVTASRYKCAWKANETVTGIAYDWGGMDSPEEFDRKLAQGYAAGSCREYGSTNCTAGIDCSGLVCLCWGISRIEYKHATRNIRNIAGRPKYNWYAEMKPGDALVKPGRHIVLFAGYREDGNPNVFEASGDAHRVICNNWATWSSFIGYYPVRYKMIEEE